MSDPTIRQLQIDLKEFGYDPGPIDGISGRRTKEALAAAQKAGLGTPALIHEWAEKHRTQRLAGRPAPTPPPGYLDLVDRCTLTEWRRCAVCRKDSDECKHAGGPLPRSWASITGITLHQTGCPMSSKPERWLNLKAHYGVTYEGGIYRIHRETDFGWHAEGQSHRNTGIEIAGFFCGVEGDVKTRPSAPASWKIQSVTPEQIVATKELIRYLSRLLVAHGSSLQLIQPHRMATDNRRPDPGSRVWQEIAIPMIAELGAGIGDVTGDGMPLPQEWDPTKIGVLY